MQAFFCNMTIYLLHMCKREWMFVCMYVCSRLARKRVVRSRCAIHHWKGLEPGGITKAYLVTFLGQFTKCFWKNFGKRFLIPKSHTQISIFWDNFEQFFSHKIVTIFFFTFMELLNQLLKHLCDTFLSQNK